MALKLIYQLLAKLLSWMVLHVRSDTCECRELCHGPLSSAFMAGRPHGHLWVPRTVTQPLISALRASEPTSQPPSTAPAA